MNNGLYLIILLVIVLIWFYLKRSTSKSKNKHSTKTIKREQDFHAISIQICPQACPAVKELRDKRILSNQAPILPLADCNVSDCKCKYVHHNDRRSHDDRRFTSVAMQNIFADKEKREKAQSDRRKK